MSLGEDRVRVTFNPSLDDLVSRIKQKTAELIDLCHDEIGRDASDGKVGERRRIWALAMTAYEEAGMWAVKAATASK